MNFYLKLPRKIEDIPRMLAKVLPARLLKFTESANTVAAPVIIETLFRMEVVTENRNSGYETGVDFFGGKFSTHSGVQVSRQVPSTDIEKIVISTNPKLYKKEIEKPTLSLRENLANEVQTDVALTKYITSDKISKLKLLKWIGSAVGFGASFFAFFKATDFTSDPKKVKRYTYAGILVFFLTLLFIGVMYYKTAKEETRELVRFFKNSGIFAYGDNLDAVSLLFSESSDISNLRARAKRVIKTKDPEKIAQFTDSVIDKLYKTDIARQYYHKQLRSIMSNFSKIS